MTKSEEQPIIPIEELDIEIPLCCKEGRDDCPHALKKVKEKQNVGL